MAKLVFTDGPNAGSKYSLEMDNLLIGRKQECGLVIDDGQVSGRHAEIKKQNEKRHQLKRK